MSIGLGLALFCLTALALAMLLAPLLLRRRGTLARDAYDLAVYRDQLGEIDRDVARGLLVGAEAEAARAEIARRILALKPSAAEAAPTATRHAGTIAVILLLPLAAGVLYWRLGSPALPDEPFAGRRAAAAPAVAANHPDSDIAKALAELRVHLKDHPDDLTGWLLLGRSEMAMQHYPEAAATYRHAADLSGQRADIMGDWGEAQVLAADGMVTSAAQEAFTAGLRDPDTAPRSRYYLALAQLQQGKTRSALDSWLALAADAPADAEWLPLVRQRIAETASSLGIDPATLNPSPGAMPPAADLSPEARPAMILAMVGKLAARLADQPDDVEGWARLGRSYMVLKEPEKASEAYAHALKLKPDDPQLKAALTEANAAAQRAVAPATAK